MGRLIMNTYLYIKRPLSRCVDNGLLKGFESGYFNEMRNL